MQKRICIKTMLPQGVDLSVQQRYTMGSGSVDGIDLCNGRQTYKLRENIATKSTSASRKQDDIAVGGSI
jgi:hypothetical protein